MKNLKIFNIGDQVKVVMNSENASDFSNKFKCPLGGVYRIRDWENKIFTIAKKYEPITFKHNLDIYGAYPLSLDGVIVGCVYNHALEIVEEAPIYCVYVHYSDPDGNEISYPVSNSTSNKELAESIQKSFEYERRKEVSYLSPRDHSFDSYCLKSKSYSIKKSRLATTLEEMTKDL